MAKEDIEKFKFEKGQSGNPNGRPVGSKNRSTIAKKWLELNTNETNPLTNQIENLSQEDIITLKQIEKAKDGDSNAYKLLMDSTYGMPQQQTEVNATVTNKEFKPIEFVKTKDGKDK
jgi:hypothetical protein